MTSAWPWPARRGLQARTLELAELFAVSGELTILAPLPESNGERPPAVAGVRIEGYRQGPGSAAAGVAGAAFSGRSFQSGLFAGAGLRRRVRELEADADLVVLQTSRLAALAAGAPGLERRRLVIDLVDSLSFNFASRARIDRAWKRPFWLLEARRLERDERRLVASSRSAWVVSDRDRRHLAERAGADLAPRIATVPLMLRERPAATRPLAPHDQPFTLLVTGNLGYFPTRHGIDWLLDEVWPAVRARLGGARLRIAGSRPAGTLARRAVAAGAELVRDPEDLGAELRGADLALAPLFGGSGTPMKLLEAIAHGVPVLATPYAAAGLEPELAALVEARPDASSWIETIAWVAGGAREASAARARAAREAALRLHAPAAVKAAIDRSLGRE